MRSISVLESQVAIQNQEEQGKGKISQNKNLKDIGIRSEAKKQNEE
jgi:hypothetical protein